MGALADELVDVLGDAFSAPTAHALTGKSRAVAHCQFMRSLCTFGCF